MKGFTLIETLIAITILTLAIAGPMVTASRSIVAAQTARDQLTASYLAQEGIEYVRAMRDNEYLTAYQAGGSNVSTTAWNNFLTASINQCRGATCTLDPSEAWVRERFLARALLSRLVSAAVSDATFKRYLRVHRAGAGQHTIHAYDTSD